MDVMLRVSISFGGSTPAIQRDSWLPWFSIIAR
jgi:hypothetical protein